MRGGRESRTSQLFDMTDINELPTTPGGIRQMADVDMTVPVQLFRQPVSGKLRHPLAPVATSDRSRQHEN